VPQRLQNQQVILLPLAEMRLCYVSVLRGGKEGRGKLEGILVRSHLVFARNAGEFGEDSSDAEGGARLETAFVAVVHGVVVSIISVFVMEGRGRERKVILT
jgi:hypothetical protein